MVQLVEKQKTKKTKHTKTKKTITASKQTQQSIETADETHEHVAHAHTLIEQQLQTSRTQYDHSPENTITELITDSVTEQRVQPIHHSIYPQHEINPTQIGDEIGAIDMQECKVHAVIDKLQSLSASETNFDESVVPIQPDQIPKTTQIRPTITTKQSLVNDEILPNDTCDELRATDSIRSATARVEYVTVEAKMIDERYTQEKESDYHSRTETLPTEKAEITISPMHSIEVQMQGTQETVSDRPDQLHIQPAIAELDVPSQKSLSINEIVCEQKASPFQPERMIGRATAVTDFELCQPYNVEEVCSSELENEIPAMPAVTGKQARVNVTCMDSVAIDQTFTNEFESDLIVSEVEHATADKLIGPHHSMQTNMVEQYEANDLLDNFKYDMSRAQVELNDFNVRRTETTTVYQGEDELKPDRTPESRQATATFVSLKSSITEQTVPNEMGTDFTVDSTNVEYATHTSDQSKVLEVSSVQPFDSLTTEMPAKVDREKQNAKITLELQRPTMSNVFVCPNEKESEFWAPNLEVKPTVRHDISEFYPIESGMTEPLESESIFESEQSHLRQSKVVPGHPLTLGSVNVVESCDAEDRVHDQIKPLQNAKVTMDNVQAVSSYSVHATEQTVDGVDDTKPVPKFASPNLIHQNAVTVTTHSTEESFKEMEIDSGENEKQRLSLKQTETVLQSANVFEPRELENVGDMDVFDQQMKLRTAIVQFDGHNQVNVSATTVSEQTIPCDVMSSKPTAAQAMTQYAPQTAATTSLVQPSDSTCDLVLATSEQIDSKFSVDAYPSLCIREEICPEEASPFESMAVESKQSSGSFVHQTAAQRTEINVLENPDILEVTKEPQCVGNSNITNTFSAAEVSDCVVYDSNNILDAADTKLEVSAKPTAESLVALETTEHFTLESSANLQETETRIPKGLVSSIAHKETLSHTVHTQDVFEKETSFDATEVHKHKNVQFSLQSPMKSTNISENVQLDSVEQLMSDQIQRVESMQTNVTTMPMSRAVQESNTVLESEEKRTIDAPKVVTSATMKVTPHEHITIDLNEIDECTDKMAPTERMKETTCQITNESNLIAPLQECVITSETTTDRIQSSDERKTANLKASETHGYDIFETTVNMDYHIPNESAVIRGERELHSLIVSEKDRYEKEKEIVPRINENIHRVTRSDEAMHELLQPIQPHQELINIHKGIHSYNEQLETTTKVYTILTGKLVCFRLNTLINHANTNIEYLRIINLSMK